MHTSITATFSITVKNVSSRPTTAPEEKDPKLCKINSSGMHYLTRAIRVSASELNEKRAIH